MAPHEAVAEVEQAIEAWLDAARATGRLAPKSSRWPALGLTSRDAERRVVCWFSTETPGFLGLLYSLAVLLPALAVGVRRPHDTGRSG
ncbi:MAG: hypothetical protein WCC65_02830 [Pseudonocardiaceae bacterium]